MTDDPVTGAYWVWIVAELAFLVLLLALTVGSLVGVASVPFDLSRPVRIAAAAFRFVELLIPAWVYVDLGRRGVDGSLWMHAAAMPGVNLFGLWAYLGERRRAGGR